MNLLSGIMSVYRHIKVFGKKGLGIYCRINSNRTEGISLNNINHPFDLRSKTSDIRTFYEIFFWREYDIQIDFDPKIIIDAGANIGLSAIFFANKYPNAKIISIEPEVSNYMLLKKNTRNYSKIITLNNALSNIGNQDLNVIDNGLGNWGFITESVGELENINVKNIIKTVSIDDIMKQNNLDYIDIVKIDIEGYEKELFETNTENWLPKTRCIIIELHDRMKPGCSNCFFKAISQYDFSFNFQGENLIFKNNNEKLHSFS